MTDNDQKSTGGSNLASTGMILAALGGVFLGLWMTGQTLATSIAAEGEANRILTESLLQRVDGLTRAVHNLKRQTDAFERARLTAQAAPAAAPPLEGDAGAEAGTAASESQD